LTEDSVRPVILIVEDDDAIRDIVGSVLESQGYTARIARNGLEGLEQFYLILPDLIIMDVNMPQMDGWETLRKLRQVSGCPVIMLTVSGSTEDIVKGLELGADDYLSKPFGAQELVARVNAVLRRDSLVR
jgi:DNA-binding response OmpR family regulator